MAQTTTQTECCIEADVMELTGFSLEEIQQMKYEQGVAYLHWYLPNSPVLRRKAENCKTYWGWWKNIWHTHDEVFVYNSIQINVLMQSHIQLMYKELHSGRNIANDGTHPPKVVIESIHKTPLYATCS